MISTLKISKHSLLNKCFHLFSNLEIPKFLNTKGPKLYTISEKLNLLVFKIVNKLDYRETVKYALKNKFMHFTTLQKFANKLTNYLKNQIKKASKQILQNLKNNYLAIDGTGLSKCQASRYYERQVGFLKSAKLYDKLSILIDIDSLCILKYNF